MPSKSSRLNAHIHSFNRGEVSAAALARTDLEQLRLAAEVQENLLPYVLGKGVARPGSKYIATTPSSNQARLLPFVFSVSDKALIELTDSLMRVYVNDALITRASVTSTVTNGTFTATDGWLTTVSGNATLTFTGGVMTMSCPSVGGHIQVTRPVTTTSTGTEHALRIIVDRGPVTFRVGTTASLGNYISETALDTGQHSLAFTPTDGTYHVWFHTRSETEVKVDSIAVESAGVMTLPTPYTSSDLRNVRFDQSGDIIFLANEDYQQRKIERRGTRSWSFVKYQSNAGPFTLTKTADIVLNPQALTGNTTLTADRDFFDAGHVGALFRLTHTGQSIDQTIATDGGAGGAGYFTDTVELPPWFDGTKKPSYSYVATDTADAATGTWTLEASFEGPDIGFQARTNATDQRITDATNESDDTTTTWLRLGLRNGEFTNGVWRFLIDTDHGGGTGIARVTSVSSGTVAAVEILDHFANGLGTHEWQESEWSDVQGWPSAVCLFDGRLWWAGRDKVWGSVSDDYTNFDDTTEGDAGPILRNIATGAVNQARWLLPLTRLMIGTEGSEVSAKASSLDNPLTPTEFSLRDVSTQGSAAVSPVKADTVGYFVQRSGKRLYALTLDSGLSDYASSDMTRINDDIAGTGTGFVELSVQRQPDTRIWCVRSDGVVALLIHDPAEEVAGWVKVITGQTNQNSLATDGFIESVCVLPGTDEDDVYIAVKRIVNGSVVRYVEKFAKESEAIGTAGSHYMADSYATLAGPASSMSGMTHLNSEQVIAWGTSVTGGTTGPLGTFTVTDGAFAIGKSCTNIVAGLGYNWRYKSAKLAYGAQGATSLLQPKKVSSLGIIAENLLIDSVTYGRDFDHLVPLPRRKDGAVQPANTLMSTHDERAFPFTGNWDTDSRVCMKGSAPYPFTALGIVIGLELEEKA